MKINPVIEKQWGGGEHGIVETDGVTRTFRLKGEYTSMDALFLQVIDGEYPGALQALAPITFSPPSTITFKIGNDTSEAGAKYKCSYIFFGH